MRVLKGHYTKIKKWSSIRKLAVISIASMLVSLAWIFFSSEDGPVRATSSSWGVVFDQIGFAYVSEAEDQGFTAARVGAELREEKLSFLTRQNSHLFIDISQSGGRIELGQDTQVGITAGKSTPRKLSISLELVKGEIFVGVLDRRVSRFTLTWRGEKVLETTDGDFQARIVGDEVLINMHRGQASVLGRTETLQKYMSARVSLNRTQYFEDEIIVLTPFPNERVFQTITSPRRVRFAWADVTPGAKVQLYAGTSRSSMKSVWRNPVVADSGEGFAIFGFGQYYWKLQSTIGSKTEDSAIFKLFVTNEVSPRPISPTLSDIFFQEGNQNHIDFFWKNPSRLESLVLEISTDEKFENLLVKEPVADLGFRRVEIDLNEGNYFWRVSGFRHDSSELLYSPVNTFRTMEFRKGETKLRSFPNDGASLYADDLKNSEATFIWEKFSGFPYKRITVETEGGGTQVLLVSAEANSVAIPPLSEGEHTWILEVSRDKTEWSAITTKKRFTVKNVDRILISSASKVGAKWKTQNANVKSYRVIVKPLVVDPRGAKDTGVSAYSTKGNQINFDFIPSDIFGLKIQGLNGEGEIVAQSRELLVE